MNWLVNRLVKLRLFQGDLDLHLVRASMVILYFFFGYQKWFDYEAQGLIPFFTHGPPHPLDVFGLRDKRVHLFPWRFGMAIRSAAAGRILEQKPRHPGCARIGGHVHHHRDDHSLYAGRLGSIGRRISRHGRERRFPDEGCSVLAASFYLLKQDLVRASALIKVGIPQEMAWR
jgi:hypothetical protein